MRAAALATIIVPIALSCARADVVGLLVERFALESADIAPLLLPSAGTGAARAQANAAVERGEARLVELSYIVGRTGQRARMQGAIEYIYPTEWDPPEIAPAGGRAPGAPFTVDVVPSSPTAFELRDLGQSTEVEFAERRDALGFSLATESVRLHEPLVYGAGPSRIEQPLFGVRKLLTRSDVGFGASKWIGAIPFHGRDGKPATELVLAEAFHLTAATPPEGVASSDDPFASPAQGGPPAPTISISVDLIEVALPLFREILAAAEGHELWEILDPALEGGAARSLASARVHGLSGQRVKVEDIYEFIYPTEFDSGDFGAFLPEGTAPPPPGLAFEMRPVGMSCEVDAVLAPDGRSIALNLAPEWVRFVRFVDYGHGEALAVQPVFEAWETSTALRIAHGEELLVAAASSRRPEDGAPLSDRVCLTIVGANVAGAD